MALLEVRSMSAGFNQAVLLGRCKAIEELQTKNGKLFVKATIAVSVRRKNAEGVDEERTSFIPAIGQTEALAVSFANTATAYAHFKVP
jgi:hypothetical protein